MVDYLNALVNFLSVSGEGMLNFYNSAFFSVIKFILGVYAVVLLVDIILLLVQRGLGGNLRETLLGANIPPELVTRKGRLQKKWERVRVKMRDENESRYKVAIIEADNIIDDLIGRMGYKGENMGERLAGINPGQIENIEDLKKAHEVRNRIIHEEDFRLTKEQAEEILGYYEAFLKYFQVLS